jgi:hypothetical protein
MGTEEIANDVNDKVEPIVNEKSNDGIVPLKQHEIAAMLTNERKKAHEKGYQRGLTEAQTIPAHSSEDQIAKLVEQVTRQKIEEHLNQQQDAMYQQQAKAHADSFKDKIDSAHKKYGDEFLQNFGGDVYNAIKSNAYLVPEFNNLSNADDVLFELSKNPEKLANIIGLASAGMHGKAKSSLESISKSFNADKSNLRHNQEPINEIQPSHAGVGKDLVRELQDEIKKMF